ncbi:AlpA family transcriptional regulator [Ochrobactrum sp. MH181795]|uniref:helix-turn-helix transcriptional regulator n=1 Tax=Brucella TaxID=234 RepID=UPI0001B4818A|nr:MULTISPECIES: AlpA family transcriptional regulator [Brucella]ERI14448.1 DNA-binding protein [Ochrobactrum sp. EGD-AQ16]MCR5939810.1 AlpA family transcriptional regulator [Ochrobactrum sp. XJ1]RNL45639.1 AlpA family transcriptional regulator [Ochrobactrum sp. MH181795]EEZ31813.1 conserved hypothetical protein [Brucella sp. 83/13]EFM61428.1 hypothetical DNA-binding protein [Brucella sp. NF 2653]
MRVDTDPLLTVRECTKLLQMSVPTFYRRVADGTFPKPIKMGALSRWSQAEIIAAIEDAKSKRQAA